MPTQYEVAAVLEDVCKAVLKPYGVKDFNNLDEETLFTIAIACFSAARAAVVAAKGGSDDEARAWFEHLIADRWKRQP